MRIAIGKPDIGREEIEAVEETMRTGWVTQGERVEEFEKAFAKYCGVKYGVAVNTGTAALHVALASIGIKRGDEVITTPLSCIATANPIRYLNSKPVFVDVDPKTLNINPSLIKKKITEKTKAIVPVHLFGHPADIDPIMETAETSGLYVIEDAAQAHGAKYKGRKVGSIGHISCFSFYADKLITTVEGGIAVTNDSELAEKMRSLRNLGMDKHKKFYHPMLGYNYKMSDIHASIGIVQLKKLDSYITKRRENVAYLNEKLNDLNLKLPSEEDYAFNVYYVYHILVNNGKEKTVEYLEREGIETRPLLSFIPAQPPYQNKYDANKYPVARNAHQKGFYVSNSPQLTRNDLNFLVSALRKAVSRR
ncbi:MAG: UDP-4-amino-4-deoxy-L-arabinose--oxoglutarate aminotransferase [Candidatus Bathyarchaeota archaeon BA2]|nr:MAG: UDP-4-amino-4-deoxy-L-arabinose--oxoglutarate aminotransferase [Candidatus Bathyarchaeota archaeon BA2]